MCRNRGVYGIDPASDVSVLDLVVEQRMEEYLNTRKAKGGDDPYTGVRTREPIPPKDMRSEAERKLEDYRDRLKGVRAVKPIARPEMDDDDDAGLPEPPRPDWADQPEPHTHPVFEEEF